MQTSVMELPVRCGRCGLTSVGDLIIPPNATASLLAEATKSELPFDKSGRRCPLCRAALDQTSLEMSKEIAKLLTQSYSSIADLRNVEDSMRAIVANGGDEASADFILARGKMAPLRRLIPTGQTNILAFCTLVIAIATLLESTMADFLYQPSQSAPSMRNATSLEVTSTHSDDSAHLINLSGYFDAPDGFSPWVIKISVIRERAARRGLVNFTKFQAYEPTITASTWHCQVDYTWHYRGGDLYLVVVLLDRPISASARNLRDVESEYSGWLAYPVAGPVTVVTLKGRESVPIVPEKSLPEMLRPNGYFYVTEIRRESIPIERLGELMTRALGVTIPAWPVQ